MSYATKLLRRITKAASLITEPTWFRRVMMVSGMTNGPEIKLLHKLASETKSGCIVEVGSYRGRSTCALAYGSASGHQAPVFAIEPHEEFEGVLGGHFGPEDRAAFYRAMLRTSAYKMVRLLNTRSEVLAPSWDSPISLLWLDGDHSYEGVSSDLEYWQPHLTEDAVVAFDDSTDPSCGPYRLIEQITESGAFERVELVGKISVLRYLGASQSSQTIRIHRAA